MKKKQTEIHFENDTNRITEEEAEHLFERFFVPDNSEKQGSTGLGLTIARYLAEAMGASLEAELTGAAGSETGKKGSAAGVIRFTLRFSKGQISAISEKD
ncbi:MAG: sensor histidine kinase [Eisenbergiella sp.]